MGKRYVDRMVEGYAHEAKAGLNVRLNSSLELQMMKDAELVAMKAITGVRWHFFRGATQEVIDALKRHGISYTIH